MRIICTKEELKGLIDTVKYAEDCLLPISCPSNKTCEECLLSQIEWEIDNEPKKGKWEIVDEEGGKIWNCVCPKCGHDPLEYISGSEDWWLRKPLPNYCPCCGADMRGDEDGNTN